MATFTERNGKIFVQIRRKGFPLICKTFKNLSDAEDFAKDKEQSMSDEINAFNTTTASHTFPISNLELRQIYYRTKKRSNISGIAHTLTQSEFMELFSKTEGKCAISGLHFSGGRPDNVRVRPYFPSLDRIDSSKGYTKDNVRFVSTAVNIALSDWGEDILRNIAFGIASTAILSYQSNLSMVSK